MWALWLHERWPPLSERWHMMIYMTWFYDISGSSWHVIVRHQWPDVICCMCFETLNDDMLYDIWCPTWHVNDVIWHLRTYMTCHITFEAWHVILHYTLYNTGSVRACGLVDACRPAIGGSQVQTCPRLPCYSFQQGDLSQFICWIGAFTPAAHCLVNGFKWHCHICQSVLEMSL